MSTNLVLRVVPLIDTEGPTTGRADMYDTWDSLGTAIGELTGPVRAELPDSFGNPLIMSWFLLDWTGYSKSDAEFKRRGHDIKLHAVWDFYTKDFLSKSAIERSKDGVYWHYHHPPKDGSWGWNMDWDDSRWYEYILGKLILDHNYFPSVYRAGKYVENNASSHWLEEWIPFDYSNIAPVKREFCDWSEAESGWVPYHPSRENYQKPGDMHRLVARSLPVAAKGGSGTLDPQEVRKAFEEVRAGKQAIFSFHTHDYYKSIVEEFRSAHQLISAVSREMGIPWRYDNALDALRHHVPEESRSFTLNVSREGREVSIQPSHAIFGRVPFVVAEDSTGVITRLDAVLDNGVFHTTLLESSVRFGVGASDPSGQTMAHSESLKG